MHLGGAPGRCTESWAPSSFLAALSWGPGEEGGHLELERVLSSKAEGRGSFLGGLARPPLSVPPHPSPPGVWSLPL